MYSIYHQPPTFLAPGTGFIEDNFSTDRRELGWFPDDSHKEQAALERVVHSRVRALRESNASDDVTGGRAHAAT